MPKSVKQLRRQLGGAGSAPYGTSAPRVATKASSLDNNDDAGRPPTTTPGLSRGQRKRLDRKQHVFAKQGKWESAVVTQHKNKKRDRERAQEVENGMLSELEQTLKSGIEESGATAAIKPAAASVATSNKMKKEIALREAERMRLVQAHPAWLANPFAAMHTHIEQTLALKQQSKETENSQRKQATTVQMELAAPGDTGLPSSRSHAKRLKRKAAKQMDESV